jgi:hypothetical protein
LTFLDLHFIMYKTVGPDVYWGSFWLSDLSKCLVNHREGWEKINSIHLVSWERALGRISPFSLRFREPEEEQKVPCSIQGDKPKPAGGAELKRDQWGIFSVGSSSSNPTSLITEFLQRELGSKRHLCCLSFSPPFLQCLKQSRRGHFKILDFFFFLQ